MIALTTNPGTPAGAVQNAGQNRGRTLTRPASGLSLVRSYGRFEQAAPRAVSRLFKDQERRCHMRKNGP
jgi:hypothetical protein